MTEGQDYLPAGEHAVAPYLCVRGAAEAIEFYVDVLGAVEEGERFVDPEGKVGHATLQLGDSHLYLADEYPGYGISPVDLPDTTVALYIYVPDVDTVVARAKERGATVLEEVNETFYGARRATIRDPFGHRWMINTQIRDVAAEEHHAAVERFAEHGVE